MDTMQLKMKREEAEKPLAIFPLDVGRNMIRINVLWMLWMFVVYVLISTLLTNSIYFPFEIYFNEGSP